MAKIYRISDRIPLRVDDLEIKISPLTLDQKAEISEVVGDGTTTAKLLKGSALALKYAVKEINGIVHNGQPYQPEYDASGILSDEAVEDLFNLGNIDKLTAVCLGLINSIPEEFLDPLSGQPIEGVEFIVDKGPTRKKKRAASSK